MGAGGGNEGHTRTIIAFGLLVLIFLIAGFALYILMTINGQSSEDIDKDLERLMTLINVIFSPIMTLFGSVVGFYYGAKTAREGSST